MSHNVNDEVGFNDFADDERGDTITAPAETVPFDQLDEVQAEYADYFVDPSFFSSNNRRTQHGYT
jgi:hypothetical protein